MNDEARKLTARKVTVALYWKLQGGSDLLIPRYTPIHWWECDLWRLTRAGAEEEFEIKMSVADFPADFKKHDNPYYLAPGKSARNKHQLLRDTTEGPARFWFVVPTEIGEAVKDQIPDYAGLVVVSPYSAYVEKRAPTRHIRKWSGNRDRLMKTFYHRFWNHECKAGGAPIEPFALDPDPQIALGRERTTQPAGGIAPVPGDIPVPRPSAHSTDKQ